MLIPTGYAQVNYFFAGSNLPHGAQITFGLDVTARGDGPAAVAADAGDEWEATVNPLLSGLLTFTKVLVKYGPNDTGPSAEYFPDAQGAASGSGMAPNTALLVQKQTALGGHAGRGRFFVPGLLENNVNEAGQIDSGKVTDFQTAFDAWLAGWSGYDLQAVVLHGPGSPLTTPTPITSMAVSNLAATQRKRMRR